jgi:hypothetical protein
MRVLIGTRDIWGAVPDENGLNLATPLFAIAFMVHVHKRLSARKLIAESLMNARMG